MFLGKTLMTHAIYLDYFGSVSNYDAIALIYEYQLLPDHHGKRPEK